MGLGSMELGSIPGTAGTSEIYSQGAGGGWDGKLLRGSITGVWGVLTEPT